jgi:hypothetical protein
MDRRRIEGSEKAYTRRLFAMARSRNPVTLGPHGASVPQAHPPSPPHGTPSAPERYRPPHNSFPGHMRSWAISS